MQTGDAFSSNQRRWLWLIALAGLFGPNSIFLYHVFFRQDVLLSALSNPVALAFMALLSYLFARWRVNAALHWGWLVVLSFLGGLLFAIPTYLLLRRPRSDG